MTLTMDTEVATTAMHFQQWREKKLRQAAAATPKANPTPRDMPAFVPRTGRKSGVTLLQDLVAHLQTYLRQPDGDGVQPPQLCRMPRITRTPGAYTRGMLDSEPVTLRIHAVLMVCYQSRCCRTAAYRQLQAMARDEGECTFRNAFEEYATAEEKAYNPYRKRRG